MVKTTEANEFLSPEDLVGDSQVFTVDQEQTHRISEFKDQQTGVVKRNIVIGLIGAPRPVKLNGTSRKSLEKWWGVDTANWVGKKVRAEKTKMIVRGNTLNVLIFEPVQGSETVKGGKKN